MPSFGRMGALANFCGLKKKIIILLLCSPYVNTVSSGHVLSSSGVKLVVVLTEWAGKGVKNVSASPRDSSFLGAGTGATANKRLGQGVELLRLWEPVKEFRVQRRHPAGPAPFWQVQARSLDPRPRAPCLRPRPGHRGLSGRAGPEPGSVGFLQWPRVGRSLWGHWELGCFVFLGVKFIFQN